MNSNTAPEWRAERPGRDPIAFNARELYRWFGYDDVADQARNIVNMEVGQRYADHHGWVWERVA